LWLYSKGSGGKVLLDCPLPVEISDRILELGDKTGHMVNFYHNHVSLRPLSCVVARVAIVYFPFLFDKISFLFRDGVNFSLGFRLS